MRREERTRRAHWRRRVSVAWGIALLLGLVVTAAGPVAPRASAAAYDRFYANFEGEEVMRAINADRRALGPSRLEASPALAAAARDRAVACPSEPSLTIRGRARDMAERGYLAHDIKGCSDAQGGTFTSFDLLAAAGITWSAVGETIASNNYPSSRTTYSTGCSQSGGSCHGSVEVSWSVAVVARGWMSSSAHRPIVLSTTFTRFGCGAWNAISGTHYYSCFFTSGSNAGADGTGPSITDASGAGGDFAPGSTPTFTASADDGSSRLAEGRALLDGREIRGWAYDHAASATLTATTPPLASGTHRFEWRVRDTSTNVRSFAFDFNVGSGGSMPAAPTPTPKSSPVPTPRRTPGPASTSAAIPTATPADAPATVLAMASPASPDPRSVGRSMTSYFLDLGDAPPGPAERTELANRVAVDRGGWPAPLIAAVVLLGLGWAAARARRARR